MAKHTQSLSRGWLKKLSPDESYSLLSGDQTGFATKAIPRLGIPSLKMSDGPSGITRPGATAFPSGIAIAASFDREIAAAVAREMAYEAKEKNIQVLLAPCLGLARHPFGGRNFETFGEDPFLAAEMGSKFVEAIQSQGIAACIKHFALNDQEYLRKEIDVHISPRALRECHLRPFEYAVKAGARSVMTAYNRVNGTFASENFSLLSILKDDWKFSGLLLSDWSATRDFICSWRAGLDLEMPFPYHFSPENIEMALLSGYISEEELEQKNKKVLELVEWAFFPKKRKHSRHRGDGRAVALRAAESSIVLLKNESLLPLTTSSLGKVAVFGAGAKYSRMSGGGSSRVHVADAVCPLAALRSRLGDRLTFSEAFQMKGDCNVVAASEWRTTDGRPGLLGEYYANCDLAGDPSHTRIDSSIDFDWGWRSPAPHLPIDNFSIRWTGLLYIPQAGVYEFRLNYEYGARLYVNEKMILDAWSGDRVDSLRATLAIGNNKICFEYRETGGKAIVGLGLEKLATGQASDLSIAAQADVAIVFAGLSEAYESEEKDRVGFSLPAGQDDFIASLSMVQANIIVVLSGGNPVAMPWLKNVKAVLHSWYAGEMLAEALVRILLGEVNPSGKLPVTFPARWEDCAAFSNYPESAPNTVFYKEGVVLGHRHFTSEAIAPLFCFGHGLSYTQFSFSNLKVQKLRFSFQLKNIGTFDGAEVAQLYVQRPGEKYQLFLGFEKVFLRPKEARTVEFSVDRNWLKFYSAEVEDWQLRPGEYCFSVGSSVNSLFLFAKINLSS